MMRAIWGLARNDLAVWFRSPASIAAALLPALGMGILVAVLTNSVGQQPIALVTQGQGRFTDRMARLFKGEADAYLLKEMSAAEAQKAIANQSIAAIIVIPENFDQGVRTGTGIIDLYLNNVDIDLSDDIRRSVTRSVAEFDAPQLGLTGEEHGPSQGVLLPNAYRVAIGEHDLRSTNVSFLQYQVVPIIILIVISVGMLGTALLTARDFERRTAKMMVLSPAGRSSLVLGRLVGGILITALLVIPLLIFGFITPHIPVCSDMSGLSDASKILLSAPCAWRLSLQSPAHGLALALLLLTVTLTTVGWGTLLGVAVRDERLVTMLGLNGATYLFFLGGGFTTVAFLPSWIQKASSVVPTKYAIEGLRQALFYHDLLGIGRDLVVLAGFALVSIVISSFALTRAWRRA